MKKSTNLLTAGVLLVILMVTGCKKDDGGGVSVEQQQLAALTGTWSATSVVNDGNERTDYNDFTLTINSGMTYQTSGGPGSLPIPKSGDFVFGDNVKSKIILASSSESPLRYTYEISAEGNDLTLTSDETYTGGGFVNTRVSSVSGTWKFVFSKQ